MNCSNCGSELIYNAGYAWNSKKLCEACFHNEYSSVISLKFKSNQCQDTSDTLVLQSETRR